MKNFIAALVFSCLLSGCAATDVTPVNKGFALTEEEEILWQHSEEAQETLEEGGLLYENEEIVAYLNEVALRLWPEEIISQDRFTLEVQIIKNPLLNAITYPNGKIYVHTGILARMENEAQLATLLAHEMAHVINRDTLTSYRDLKNKAALISTFGVATSGFGSYGSLAYMVGSLGIVSSIYGYSQEIEAEADQFSLNRMYQAGYDPNEAPKLFQSMQRWLEINDIDEPFFFGTHPKLAERVKNSNLLIATQFKGVTGAIQNETYQEKIKGLILLNGALNIKAGRFQVAEEDIRMFLDRGNESAEAYFLLGEICTQNEDDTDTDKAIELYNNAIRIDPNYPEPHRELGLLYFKQGKNSEAEKHFTAYLNLSLNAIDRGYIEENLKNILREK